MLLYQAGIVACTASALATSCSCSHNLPDAALSCNIIVPQNLSAINSHIPFNITRVLTQAFEGEYEWILYGHDDTLFFVEGTLDLLQDFDPSLPYIITGTMPALPRQPLPVIHVNITLQFAFMPACHKCDCHNLSV